MERNRRKSDNQHNGKVGIREVYDLVFPMTENIEETKKDIAVMQLDITNIKDDIKDLKISIKGKISIKAFATWLSITTGLLLMAFTILGFYYRGC